MEGAYRIPNTSSVCHWTNQSAESWLNISWKIIFSKYTSHLIANHIFLPKRTICTTAIKQQSVYWLVWIIISLSFHYHWPSHLFQFPRITSSEQNHVTTWERERRCFQWGSFWSGQHKHFSSSCCTDIFPSLMEISILLNWTDQ